MYMGEEVRCVSLNSDVVHWMILYIIAWTITGCYNVLKHDADGITAFTQVIRHDRLTVGIILLIFLGIKLACILQGL